MSAHEEARDLSQEFARALGTLRGTPVRPDVSLSETPAPTRLAPHAAAFTGEVSSPHDRALSTGRLVLLHDPDGVDAWAGRYRIVVLVRAEVDGEMVNDPLLVEVGWSWLTESLVRANAAHAALAGTVTRTSSESFGSIANRPATGEIELRASWTPAEDAPLSPHLHAWAELLCVTAGLPPLTEDVVAIPRRRQPR